MNTIALLLHLFDQVPGIMLFIAARMHISC